jgi:hypothetical protein
MVDLNEVLKGCCFEKTDGYRYITARHPHNALKIIMDAAGANGIGWNENAVEYQIDVLNPHAKNVVTFIDQKLAR